MILLRLTIVLLLQFFLVSCNELGLKKVKNIVELTPRLSIETNEIIQIDSSIGANIFNPNMLKSKSYILAKNKIITEPLLVKSVMYTVDDKGTVYAFSTKDKTILWSYNISTNKKNSYIGGGILYDNDRLYITYGSRFLVVLDSKSGHEIIRKEFSDIIRVKPIKLSNNNILIQTISNQLFALNFLDLKFIWQHEGIMGTLSSSYYISPIVYDNYVIVNYNSGQIFALNADNGEILWNFNMSRIQEGDLANFEESNLVCMPVLKDSSLYIATSAGKLIKLNIIKGSVIWQTNANDIQSMTLSGNSLFITNNAQQFAVISTESGKVKFVSNLSVITDLNKIRVTAFLPPIINKSNDGWDVNIIANNGKLYNFHSDDKGRLVLSPIISKINKNIQYYGIIDNRSMYFITDKKIIFTAS